MIEAKPCNSISEDWTIQRQDFTITCNDLINAYLLGAQEQKKRSKEELQKRLEKNIISAQEVSSNFFNNMIETGNDLKFATLRVEALHKFEVIFFVSKKLFQSDSILELYKKAMELKKEVNTGKFFISFSFMPDHKDLNRERLISDGYIFVYGEQQKS